MPKVWLLTRRVRSRVFQHKTVPEILTTVFQGYDTKQQFQGTYKPRDYCVQYNESDFSFASRLMEEEGMYYFFTHSDSGHQMELIDSPLNLDDIAGDSATVYFRQNCRDLAEDEVVIQWRKSQEIRSGKYTLRDRNFELTSTLEASGTMLSTLSVGTVSHNLQIDGNSDLEIYNFPGGYATRFDDKDRTGGAQQTLNDVFDDSTRVAGLRMQEETVPAVTVRGVGTCRRFAAGAKFTLADHFDADGSYLLTRVDHLASVTDAYLGGSTESFEYANNFECSPAALAYRPPRLTPKPRIEGSQTAVVVGQQGDEIFTDAHGRVKVQFYWDRDSGFDPDSSCWVRVGSLWAGKQWGAIHIPRVGQEVIVTFLDGDPDRPIIVGSVYNGENQPPYTLPDNKTQSGLKSRSSLKGTEDNFNELRFEDLKDSEQDLLPSLKGLRPRGRERRHPYGRRRGVVFLEGRQPDDDRLQGPHGHDQDGERDPHRGPGEPDGHGLAGERQARGHHGDPRRDRRGERHPPGQDGQPGRQRGHGERHPHDQDRQPHRITLDMGNDSLTLSMGNQSIE